MQLLQVTVLPYVVTSLVAGIAGGTPALARRLASRGGLALALLWALSLALVFVSPLALPPDKGGFFFATTDVASEPRIDWLDLYIPSNPFRSLANNVVPAVVVFSILLGVAILGLPGKERILGPLSLVNDALGRAGSLLVKLTPYGLFAIAGHSAGTLRLEEFERLQAFLLVYVGLALILTLWLLPGLVSVLTGLSYRRILSLAQDPLLTAFVTANLFIVLPLLAERGKALLAEAGLDKKDADEAADVLVPASFTFPHSAKLLSLAFVLFAGWFVGAPVPAREFPSLAGAGLLSLFGSLNTAVPFLLDLVRLPADLFQLFIVSSVVNSRFGSAAAAMHTFALALLGAHLMAGRLRVERKRLLGFAAATLVARRSLPPRQPAPPRPRSPRAGEGERRDRPAAPDRRVGRAGPGRGPRGGRAPDGASGARTARPGDAAPGQPALRRDGRRDPLVLPQRPGRDRRPRGRPRPRPRGRPGPEAGARARGARRARAGPGERGLRPGGGPDQARPGDGAAVLPPDRRGALGLPRSRPRARAVRRASTTPGAERASGSPCCACRSGSPA